MRVLFLLRGDKIHAAFRTKPRLVRNDFWMHRTGISRLARTVSMPLVAVLLIHFVVHVIWVTITRPCVAASFPAISPLPQIMLWSGKACYTATRTPKR